MKKRESFLEILVFVLVLSIVRNAFEHRSREVLGIIFDVTQKKANSCCLQGSLLYQGSKDTAKARKL